MSDILQFQPNGENERGLWQLGRAFEELATAYVGEHKGEASKAVLAQDLMRIAFQKCISCKAEDQVINVAAIELCRDSHCPLNKLNTQIAAGVMVITGDKQSE